MGNIKPYKTLQECGLKMISLLVSFKYHCAITITVAFFMHLIPWYAWLPSLMAIASVRGWEKFIIWGKRDKEINGVELLNSTVE